MANAKGDVGAALGDDRAAKGDEGILRGDAGAVLRGALLSNPGHPPSPTRRIANKKSGPK